MRSSEFRMLRDFNHVNRNFLDGFRWRRGHFGGCGEGNWCDGYGRNELITPSGNGLNEPWILRIVVDGSAKFFQDYVQASIKVDVCPLWPQFLPEFLATDDLSRPFQQYQEHTERLVLHLDAQSTTGQRPASGIGLKESKTKDVGGGQNAFHGWPKRMLPHDSTAILSGVRNLDRKSTRLNSSHL